MRGTGGARARGEKKRGARTLSRAGEAAQVRWAYLSTIEPELVILKDAFIFGTGGR